MNLPRSPRTKLLLISLLLLGLCLAGSTAGPSAAQVARSVLAVAGVGGVVLWWSRRRPTPDPAGVPRLKVVASRGLSNRCGLSLVEADGQSLLVIHGDGFAEVRPLARVDDPAPDAGVGPRLALGSVR